MNEAQTSPKLSLSKSGNKCMQRNLRTKLCERLENELKHCIYLPNICHSPPVSWILEWFHFIGESGNSASLIEIKKSYRTKCISCRCLIPSKDQLISFLFSVWFPTPSVSAQTNQDQRRIFSKLCFENSILECCVADLPFINNFPNSSEDELTYYRNFGLLCADAYLLVNDLSTPSSFHFFQWSIILVRLE